MSLKFILSKRYVTIGVYREVAHVNSWGETVKQGNWQLDHNVQGFLQPRSGTYTQANQGNSPLSSHLLYCDIGIDVLEGDRIKVDDFAYRLNFIQKARGIGGVLDHQEIPADYLNDITLPDQELLTLLTDDELNLLTDLGEQLIVLSETIELQTILTDDKLNLLTDLDEQLVVL